jgi:hypothetical protein
VAAVGGDHVTLVDLRSGGTSRIDLEPGLHATSAVAVDGTHLAVAAPDGRVQVVAVHPGPGPDTGSLAGTLTALGARAAATKGTFPAVDRPGA